MIKWQCQVCKLTDSDETLPEKCPVCGSSRERFTVLEGEAGSIAPQPATAITPSPSAGEQPSNAVYRWKCQVCGYIHVGPEPPEKCPVCGAPRSRFVRLEGF